MEKTTTLYSNLEGLNTEMLDKLQMKLDIEENSYDLPLSSLFSLGARKNPKRNFLFVSKVLAKHIPVNPLIPRVTGALLGDALIKKISNSSPLNDLLLSKSLQDNSLLNMAMTHAESVKIPLDKTTLFIGFAETATALGHGMYDTFGENAHFIHTTRERLVDIESSFNFEEEHSHATSHLCYGLEKDYFNQFDRIVLVDDEMTTGNTSLNLIRALNKNFPNKEYVVVSILDWRKDFEVENYRKAEKELNIIINEVSLVKGTVEYTNTPITLEEVSYPSVEEPSIKVETVDFTLEDKYRYEFKNIGEDNQERSKSYYSLTGRFGLQYTQNDTVKEHARLFASKLQRKRNGGKTLCVGYGEYMHLPNLIASYLGDNVETYATTRSPIYVRSQSDYPIRNGFKFTHPEDNAVEYFMYNVVPNSYEEVFFILERDISEESKKLLADRLATLGVKKLVFAAYN